MQTRLRHSFVGFFYSGLDIILLLLFIPTNKIRQHDVVVVVVVGGENNKNLLGIVADRRGKYQRKVVGLGTIDMKQSRNYTEK